MIEEQRTNLLIYSAQFDNAAWGKNDVTVTANAIIAPDGTLTADAIVETATTSQFAVFQPYPFTSGVTYTGSVYVKAGTRTKVAVYLQSLAFGTNKGIVVDVSNGAFVTNVSAPSNYSIVSVGNGWYRISVTDAASSSEAASFTVSIVNDANQLTYTGDGTSGL